MIVKRLISVPQEQRSEKKNNRKILRGKFIVEVFVLQLLEGRIKKRRNGASGFGQLGSIDSIVDTRA